MSQITARVECDSISENGNRITTFVTRFPKFILAEFNTHRMIARNSSSTRAKPMKVQLEDVGEDPFIPNWVGENMKGMSAAKELSGRQYGEFRMNWMNSCAAPLYYSFIFANAGIHKQHAGRLTEPFQMVDHVSTATEWFNFFKLRCNPSSQPEIQELAYKMLFALRMSKPKELELGEWHLPFVKDLDLPIEDKLKVSTARSARSSYSSFDDDHSLKKDSKLHNKLFDSKHMSPFEHPAKNMEEDRFFGPFRGFKSRRFYLESIFGSPNKKLDNSAMDDILDTKPEWIKL